MPISSVKVTESAGLTVALVRVIRQPSWPSTIIVQSADAAKVRAEVERLLGLPAETLDVPSPRINLD